jgi:prevent-host-death family protein
MAINLKNDIKPISYIKTNAAEMMKYVNERRNPIVITQNGKARAVLVDIATYQETQDAFALLNLIKIAEKDIQDGNTEPARKVFAELKKIICNVCFFVIASANCYSILLYYKELVKYSNCITLNLTVSKRKSHVKI